MNNTNDDVLTGFTYSADINRESSSEKPLTREDVLEIMANFNTKLKKTNEKLKKTSKKLKKSKMLSKKYKKKNKKLKAKATKYEQNYHTSTTQQSSKGKRWDGLIEKSVPKLIDFATVLVDRRLPPPKGR